MLILLRILSEFKGWSPGYLHDFARTFHEQHSHLIQMPLVSMLAFKILKYDIALLATIAFFPGLCHDNALRSGGKMIGQRYKNLCVEGKKSGCISSCDSYAPSNLRVNSAPQRSSLRRLSSPPCSVYSVNHTTLEGIWKQRRTSHNFREGNSNTICNFA